MSDDRTKEMKDSRSFEERVFLRFDAIDSRLHRVEARLDRVEGRLDSIDERVEKLEAKQYDTKPIWEKALAAILEISARLDETNPRLGHIDVRLDRMDIRLDQIDARLDRIDVRLDQTNLRIEQGLEQLRSEMKAGFANQQERTDHLIRDVYWQIGALNKNILGIQADQIYFSTRLEDVEKTLRESDT